ncbi:tRNA guanosine(34) transglycosylase Tgt [Thermotoga caldifontis]|uniref:tRNA guanosine(34) transglycosylase Tgt n=1 Tax=Thermotoga caldifontis TaxID=1508419 RepID=UPI000694FF14|nr:tRNA guanosine(34) transglycosylase Tgt [Thermotoga caldifontis]
MSGRAPSNARESRFEVVYQNGAARLGRIKTSHGTFETPIFMPVGTNANVKLMRSDELKKIGATIILANAYHVAVRPGLDVIELHGGLHRFMSWDGGILTDSGGFQMFSLKNFRKVSDDGVTFVSPYDGSKLFLTPELSMDIQTILGSDIVMVLDHCPAIDASYTEALEATKRTHAWAKRCLRHGVREGQLLFAIAQGGAFEDLRRASARHLSQMDFDGFAIGGLSLGEPFEMTLQLAHATISELPEDKPRYFMGGGSPRTIIELVSLGVDMFDSVYPTRLARHGAALTSEGRINIKSSRYRKDLSPIDSRCDCLVCKSYTRSYVHHLFNRGETLAGMLLTYHNLHFMFRFMERVRKSIMDGRLEEMRKEVAEVYEERGENAAGVLASGHDSLRRHR